MSDELDQYFARLHRSPFGSTDPNSVPQEGYSISPTGWYAGHSYSSFIGQSNLLYDPTFQNISENATPILTTPTYFGDDWMGHYAVNSGATPSVVEAYKIFQRERNTSDNPFNTSVLALGASYDAASDFDIYLYTHGDFAATGMIPRLPYLVAAGRVLQQDARDWANAQADVTLQIMYRGAVAAESSILDYSALPNFTQAQLAVAAAGPAAAYAYLWRLRVHVVATGAGHGVVWVGEPQLHQAYTPEPLPFSPAVAQWVPDMIEGVYRTYDSDAALVTGVGGNQKFYILADGKHVWVDYPNSAQITKVPGARELHVESTSGEMCLLHALGGIATYVKAGIPDDTDFPATPPDGTIVLDSTNHRLYCRDGGAWKYAALT